MDTLFKNAESFIWNNARLLDRKLFAFHFKDGPRDEVIAALRPYQNADGGFGNGLEPDIRCPDSQTVPVQHGFEYLDAVGADADMVLRACDFLQTATTDEGGVPFVLPTVNAHPHAPWWESPDNPPASINPTSALVGLLGKLEIQHPWLERATDFCWNHIESKAPDEPHEMAAVLIFLRYVPDRERAERALKHIGQHLLASGLVAELGAEGYVRKPLDWAPTPDHPLRPLFDAKTIEANLDELVATQKEDGGWTIAFPAISPTCEQEWRGWVTLNTLLTLRDNGRLG